MDVQHEGSDQRHSRLFLCVALWAETMFLEIFVGIVSYARRHRMMTFPHYDKSYGFQAIPSRKSVIMRFPGCSPKT